MFLIKQKSKNENTKILIEQYMKNINILNKINYLKNINTFI